MALRLVMIAESVFHTRKNAMPIMIYSIVHTGANTQLGGLNDGLLMVANQPSTDDEVKYPAMAPTANGIKIEMTNLNIGFMLV